MVQVAVRIGNRSSADVTKHTGLSGGLLREPQALLSYGAQSGEGVSTIVRIVAGETHHVGTIARSPRYSSARSAVRQGPSLNLFCNSPQRELPRRCLPLRLPAGWELSPTDNVAGNVMDPAVAGHGGHLEDLQGPFPSATLLEHDEGHRGVHDGS